MTNERQNELFRKHLAIERKYLTWLHTELGRLYKIPECCIAQFVEDQCAGRQMSLVIRQIQHGKVVAGYVDYVPCDKCMENL